MLCIALVTASNIVYFWFTFHFMDLFSLVLGFDFTIPFATNDCGLRIEDNYVVPLFKHCINVEHPTMAVIGYVFSSAITHMIEIQVNAKFMSKSYHQFSAFDICHRKLDWISNFLSFVFPCNVLQQKLNRIFTSIFQVRFVMQYWNGDATLPSRDEMLADSEDQLNRRLKLGWPKKKGHSIAGSFQREYFNDLSKTANIENVREIFLRIFEDCHDRRSEDPINYRNDVYTIIDEHHFERSSLSSNLVWLRIYWYWYLKNFVNKQHFSIQIELISNWNNITQFRLIFIIKSISCKPFLSLSLDKLCQKFILAIF